MKRPTILLWRVLLDVGLQQLDSIKRDFQEIESRYQREGMSFLTITLPRLDDALTKALSRGRLSRDMYEGFRPSTRRGSLPALLQGFFKRIFDNDGWLLPVPDTDAIFAIRQATRLFKKVELPCSQRRIDAAYERYLSNDQCLDWDRIRIANDGGLWAAVTGYLWSDLEHLSGEVYCSPGVFGSGATAERTKRNERLSVRSWPERAEWLFPAAAHAVSREDSPDLGLINWLPLEKEEPVRVVQVPKTLKTPRTISVEPSYMMLMQQSVAKPLMRYLESKRFGFQSIRFTDQTVNRSLACLGSVDGRLSTIDLSDASDMVSLKLVRETFKGCAPTFLELLEGCRTRTAKLPCGKIIELKKFASQGSALCFPIEAMIFFTIVLYTIVRSTGRRPSRSLLERIAKKVAIYGDDIIVESRWAPDVMASLEAFGLRVNHDKSFHSGLFRESCGGDYYAGVNVTPTYVRQWDVSGTKLRDLLVDYVSLSNQLYVKGLWHASQSVRDLIADDRIPLSRYPIGVLHYASFLRSSGLKWDRGLQHFRVRGWGVRSSHQPDPVLTISGGLLGSLTSSVERPTDRSDFQRDYVRGSSFRDSQELRNQEPSYARCEYRGDDTYTCERVKSSTGIRFTHRTIRGESIREGHWGSVSYGSLSNNLPCHTGIRFDAFSRKSLELTPSSFRGESSVRPYSRSLKSRWCLTPEVVPV